jgi:hypothetical protein
MQSHLMLHILGKSRDESSCTVYHEAGRMGRFSSSIYFLLKDRIFVVVLRNSSGPLDVTDHIGRYVLQEAFRVAEEGRVRS